MYDLPKSVEIDGKKYKIRTDFRVILEIIEMLNDPELTDIEKSTLVLTMFYIDEPPNCTESIVKCFEFMDMGQKHNANSPRLMDWQYDYQYIIAPVNRVLGYEARNVEYNPADNSGGLHWWTFLAAYLEIGGDCVFSNVIGIRDKLARGKKLEKSEREWMRKNPELIKLPNRYTAAQLELMKQLGV